MSQIVPDKAPDLLPTLEKVRGRAPLMLAAVINWRDLGRWLWEYLPNPDDIGELIFAAPEPGTGFRKPLPAFVSEFYYLAKRRPNFDAYDVIFTWELRTAIATAAWRMLTRQRRARWVVLAPILKGGTERLLPLLRILLRNADRIVCFSRAEARQYPKMLRLPEDKVVFHPLAFWEERSEENAVEVREDGYVLAIGHSNRDYATLLEAIRDTDIPLTIVANDTDWLQGRVVPTHVTLRCRTHFHETNDLMAHAAFHVIPLVDGELSAGQTVLLRAMAYGKAVIVTDTAGIHDYVAGVDAVTLVPPNDADALRLALTDLWQDSPKRQRMGSRAKTLVHEKYSLASLTQDMAALAEQLVNDPMSNKTRKRERGIRS